MPKRIARRVAMVGWDAADWKVIHPLIDRGLMPNLQSILEAGVMGNLATLDPPVSPLLWTSIATGHTADRHGIANFVEPDPISGALRPVASTTRKTKALWNIVSQAGLRSGVVNWFASHPAEPIAGVVVSDVFRAAPALPGAPWPLAPLAVHPAALEQTLAELRVAPADLSGDDLGPFLPRLGEIDQDRDDRPARLAAILAENITTHAAATWIAEHQEWDLLAVYYDTIDHAGHLFMPYRAPQLGGISDRDFELYRDVIDGVYCYQDMMLGRLMRLAGPETVFIVLSDHGFHSDHRRPRHVPELGALNLMEWHRPQGMIAIGGPGIRRDELVFGAGLLDVAPTVLALLGLPIGADMRGRVLVEAFAEPVEVERIPSWEDLPGSDGRHPLGEENPWEAAAVVDQLVALGYVEPRNEELERQLEGVREQQDYLMARVHLAGGRPAEAIPLLERVVRLRDNNRVYRLLLAQAYVEAGRLEDGRVVLDAVVGEAGDRPVANLLRGNLAFAEKDYARALEHLLRAEADSRPLPDTRLAIGRVYLAMKRWGDAERQFHRVLEIDPESAAAHYGLAAALLALDAPQEAASAALDAIGLCFEDAPSHYTLGVALARMGESERAAQAFQNCLVLRPDLSAARDALAALGVGKA
jgi:tetratricopeptide (TPR) repeat protein